MQTVAVFTQVDPPGRRSGVHWVAQLYDASFDPLYYPLAIAWITDWPAAGAADLGPSLDYILVPDHRRRRGHATALIAACRERFRGLWLTDPITESGEGLLDSLGPETEE